MLPTDFAGRRSRFPGGIAIFLPPVIWGVALVGSLQAREPFVTWFYCFIWWPTLLLLDGLLLWKQGESWLWARRRELLRLFCWSVTIWLVFEALNLRLHNWRYVGLPLNWWVRWPGYALSFATVLPAILLTARLLAALGLGLGRRGRPLKSARVWEPAALLVGTACLILPLIWPRYAFPLVWGAFFFLLDPLVRLLGGRSLIQVFLSGERREHLCLICAGLICGLWWELWNFPAAPRWVYTLAILNFGKIFEMPVLGFLGFLPFALECAVMYNFMNALEERVLNTPRRCRYAVVFHLAFWIIMFAAIDAWTVISFK